MNTPDPRRSYINTLLIALNIVWFLFLSTQGRTEYDMDMMLRFGACYEPLVIQEHQYWRLLSSCFMHFGMAHLANNMIVLFALGDMVESELGHLRYLLFYLLCGIGGNILSVVYGMSTGAYGISAGASGAIFGVEGMLLYMAYRRGGSFSGMSSRRLMISIALSVYLGAVGGGVDVAAHVGGLLCGVVLCAVFYHPPRRERI